MIGHRKARQKDASVDRDTVYREKKQDFDKEGKARVERDTVYCIPT